MIWGRALCTAALLSIGLAACTFDDPDALAFKSGTEDSRGIVIRHVAGVPVSPSALNDLIPAAGLSQGEVTGLLGMNMNVKKNRRESCRLGDRFDSRDLIAYNFSDRKSRVGLKLDMDTPGFSGTEVRSVMVNFRYRFQPEKAKREKCLYDSPWQGLAGSGYNEVFERDQPVIYDELDEELERIGERAQRFLDF